MMMMMLMMQNLLQMHLDNQKKSNRWMADSKLDEWKFRSIVKFDNKKSSWKAWRRRFLCAVRDCDESFSDLIEGLEGSQEPLDNLSPYSNATQVQQSTNLYNRLLGCTTGVAFQIVESVPLSNGGEAWRLLNNWFDPKTDARLTSLVLSIIGYKIKGKDVHGGLAQWENRVSTPSRDHNEGLSENIRPCS